MKTPLAIYNLEANIEPKYDTSLVAFACIVDKRYKLEIQRINKLDSDGYYGNFVVFDGCDNDKIILDKPTEISYAARFGADMMDVARWQMEACEVIDELNK
jgi:hypothetical protein